MSFVGGDFTEIESSHDGSTALSYDTGSHTFLQDTLYLVWAGVKDTTGPGNPTVLTGTGLSITNAAADNSNSDQTSALFHFVPTSDTTTPLTISGGGVENMTHATWSIIQVANSVITGTDGADAIVQTIVSPVTSTTNLSATLSTAITVGNAAFSGFQGAQSRTFTPNDTQIGFDDFGVGLEHVMSQYNLSEVEVLSATINSAALFSVIGVEIAAEVTGPTVTGPDTVTDGTSFTLTGTDLDTGTPTVALKETAIAASSKSQTIGTPTATTIPNVQGDTGQDELRDSAGFGPLAGIAIKASILASGATAAVHQHSFDNGTDPEATHTIASGITVDAGLTTVQTMIAVATTTSGQSFYGSNIVVAEDNHQVVYPTTTNGVTLTADASGNGEFTYSHAALVSAGGSITFDALYYSPANTDWGKVTLTLTEAGLNVIGLTGLLTSSLTSSLTSNLTG